MENLNINEPVKIRTRKLVNGNETIYFDITYKGQRKQEFLKLYLLAGNTRDIKARNKETMAMVQQLKAKRIMEIQSQRFDLYNKDRGKILLLDWMWQIRDEAYGVKSANYMGTIKSTILHLEGFIGRKKITLSDVDKNFIYAFLKYMRTTPTYRGVPLGKESVYTYYMCLCISLNKAVKRELIERNPCDFIPSEDKPKRSESHREYLTLEEVKKMMDTECKDIRVKRLFLFSCFTGLRYKDIFYLKWKNIIKVEEGVYQLEIVQQKTKQLVTVPLSENAIKWLPERYMDGEENRIFQMPETSCAYDYLHDWSKKAGITKNVTFHVARHTYATLLLYYGADLYTVSKLLGHTNVRTTQIYAKVMDESKRKAVSLIPNI